MAKEKFISLKEAAQLSGYSPDYVGQLIRAGKLPGKQVFLNVAWVTTEDALREYMERKGNKKSPAGKISGFWLKVKSTLNLELIYKSALGVLFAFLLGFMLLLGYVLSVAIDHHIERGYQQQLEHGV